MEFSYLVKLQSSNLNLKNILIMFITIMSYVVSDGVKYYYFASIGEALNFYKQKELQNSNLKILKETNRGILIPVDQKEIMSYYESLNQNSQRNQVNNQQNYQQNNVNSNSNINQMNNNNLNSNSLNNNNSNNALNNNLNNNNQNLNNANINNNKIDDGINKLSNQNLRNQQGAQSPIIIRSDYHHHSTHWISHLIWTLIAIIFVLIVIFYIGSWVMNFVKDSLGGI